MYFGVEQSTDSKCKNTVIIKFSENEKEKMKKWYNSEENGRFTYSVPIEAQNFHHTLRYIYEYDGYLTFNKKLIDIMKNKGTSMYPIEIEDAKAMIIHEKCKFLDIAEINKL